MRRLFLAFVVLSTMLFVVAPAQPASAAINFVQSATFTVDLSSSSSTPLAFDNSVTPGNTIIVAASWADDTATGFPLTCSDNQGNHYVTVITNYDSTNTQSLGICYATNVASGPTTVTANLDASRQFRRVIISEYSGISYGEPVDMSKGNINSASTAPDDITTGAIPTSMDGDLIFGAVMDTSSSTTLSAGTGYTLRDSLPDMAIQDRIQTSAGSIASTFTLSNNGHRYIAQMVAFKSRANPIVTVVQGYADSCALTSTGQAFCWGHNNYGQSGDGTNSPHAMPRLVVGGHTWRSIDVGCGVTTNGDGYCWGSEFNGEMGNGAPSNSVSFTPSLIAGSHKWTVIRSHSDHRCGIETDGDAYCWGDGSEGQLGESSVSDRDQPAIVINSHKWKDIDVGGQHSCGLDVDGSLYCWGSNDEGQLGDNTTSDRTEATLVDGGYTWTDLSVGLVITCGVTQADAAYCWGYNGDGQLGDNSTTNRDQPNLVSGGHSWREIAAGDASTCALYLDGTAHCWGDNALGELGAGPVGDSDEPVAVSSVNPFADINTGSAGACALTPDSVVYCWGNNNVGQVGVAAPSTFNEPYQVISLVFDANTTEVKFQIAPVFSFTIAGYNAGACNGATIDSTGSTGTAMSLRPSSSQNRIAGQTLTVGTNAAGGYTVFTRYSGVLSDGGSATIADWTGTNAAPTTFSSAGTAAFGYTTDDSLSGSATRFQSNKWAKFTTSNEEVAFASSGPVSDVVHVCAQVGISGAQAATSYTTTVIYTAVPSF